MKLDPILTRASRLARSGKYEASIRTLEPEVNRYHGSYNYYYLLGSACLRAGDFGGALTYFRLAHEVKVRDPLAILGLAVLYLRRGDTDRAVDYYLDILESDPQNPVAKKAMKVLRRQAGTDTFSAWIEAGNLPALYPPIPWPGLSLKEALKIAAALLAAACITLGVLVQFKAIPSPLKPKGGRAVAAEFLLTREDRRDPLQSGGSYRYILTRIQALDTYEKALSLFTAYRDEAARINLNRILESNASDSLKNRAQIIISYMEPPGFDTFKRGDNVDYAAVMTDSPLYNGVHVIWRGMATNVATTGSVTTFDFLVGYDTRKVLEGIVVVTFNHAVSINPEHPLELLGRIVLGGSDGSIRLEGLAIYQPAR